MAALATVTPGREIGEALLDQRIVCGIGNVYKSESLFLAGIDPWRAVGSLSFDEATALGATAARLLHTGTLHRGPISTYDPPGWLPSRGPSGQNWVYGRRGRPCRRCGTRRPRPRPRRRPSHDVLVPGLSELAVGPGR